MFPKVNDFVYIQVASVDKNEVNKECKSRIADIEEESFLIGSSNGYEKWTE